MGLRKLRLQGPIIGGELAVTLQRIGIPDYSLVLLRTIQIVKMLGDSRADILAFLIENDAEAPVGRQEMLRNVRTYHAKSNSWRSIDDRTFDRGLKWLLSKGYVRRIGRGETGRRASYYRMVWVGS